MFFPMSWTSPLTVAMRNLPAYCESSSPCASGSRPCAIKLSRFSFSMNGNKYATAFFITRALLITCGRNILPAPNKSPTTFMPCISGPSMTSRVLPPRCSISERISSVSLSTCSLMPFTNAWVSLSAIGRSRQLFFLTATAPPPRFRSSMASFSASVAANRRSVASGRRFSTASSHTSRSCGGTSTGWSISAAFTIPTSMPDDTHAWCKK
mmetsp:Transcript_5568/g.15658  ORF Transcript_5568/g.15658 Transcript_5568/m.15658 type:complete len:210 (+) Transcript_5568:138-767(+)